MSDEVQQELAELPASDQVVTATPDSGEVTPGEAQVDQAPKTFSQEELDAIVGKRLAREQRKWERDQQSSKQPAYIAPTEIPSPDQFDSTDAYIDALVANKAEQMIQQRETQRQHASVAESYHALEEKALDKYDDFEQVVYNKNLRITDTMADVIRMSDIGPDVAYYLGVNEKEASRISDMSPVLQAREIGRIEAKLTANPPTKRTTPAPAPISPVTARTSGNPSYDTTDPRSIKAMSTSDWIEADRRRQIKKLQAQTR